MTSIIGRIIRKSFLVKKINPNFSPKTFGHMDEIHSNYLVHLETKFQSLRIF